MRPAARKLTGRQDARAGGWLFGRRSALVLGFALASALFFSLARMRDAAADRELANARTTDEIAHAILGSSAKVIPNSTGRNVAIHYDLSGWFLTQASIRSNYLGNVIRLVPTIFERHPEFSQVEVVANNIFGTVQGREVRQPALSVMFTRGTAVKLDWSAVSKYEIVQFADRAWVTPTIGWQ